MTLKQNTLLVIGVIIITAGFAGGYYLSYSQLSNAADVMFEEATVVSTKLENVTLIPFKGDLRMTYSVRNPTEMEIVLNMDADLYYGDAFVGHVVSTDQVLPPSTRTDFVVKTSIEGALAEVFEQGSGKSWSLEGTTKFSGSAFGFIPVTVTKTGVLSAST